MATTRNHNRIARPQVETTILVEGTTAKVIKCTARKSFTVGNSHIAEGETFFLVASERRESRYYVVHFDATQNRPQCSCGANHKEHAHIEAYKVSIPAYTAKQVVETVAQSVESSIQEIDVNRKLTAAEWKEIAKQDKARQRAWQSEYRKQAEALRKEAAIA